VRESTVRRLADHLGYRVEKSSQRTVHLNNNSQYQLVEVLGNYVVLGANYDATLADLEDWLCREALDAFTAGTTH